ncbi:hypothetical protein MB84_28710 (plasmid) [Pandoraea oxalativorans]|uniref:Transposase IS66 central domain-containing protein n=1 Tax=Pandoraea oxalativorans TaxID=573737 RepID=A0A0G3IHY6_9BURK|nr:hypothetical protein MB84_28710 [Pandoraea oxalativorans]
MPVIGVPSNARVWIAAGVTDMRCGFNGPAAKVESVPPTLSAQSDTAKAIPYSLNRRPALADYCEDGPAQIDNRIAERALRGVAIGRRNDLFAGAGSGGERTAAMYSA